MIEKIRTTEQGLYNEHGTFLGTMPKDTDSLTLANKINELVDAVNELQEFADFADKNLAKLMEDATRTENVQDKFAEQRKWIGKLCWFWDTQEEYKFVGILGEVADNGTYFQKDGIVSYLNCEPVKPDSDIIYKGGDNE